MMKYKILTGLKIATFVVGGIILFTYVVMSLWNWLMPDLFGLPLLDIWQAAGLLILSKILFGGFHKGSHSSKYKSRFWGNRMKAKWGNMNDEEKEAFKSKMKGRWGGRCGNFGEEEAPASAS